MAWGGSNITNTIKTISQQNNQGISEEELAAMSPSQRNAYLTKISKAANQRFSATPSSSAPSTSHARFNTQG
jgi:hypothetical protein